MTDVNELPEELRAQLRTGRVAIPVDEAITEAVNESELPLTVNDILVAVWRKTGAVVKRPTMIGKLNRMVKAHELRKCGQGAYTGPLPAQVPEVPNDVDPS